MASRNGSQAGRGVADAKIVSGVSIRRGWPHSTLKSALTLCFMQNRTQSAVKLDKEPYRYKKPTWSYVGIAGITKRSTPRGFHNRFVPACSAPLHYHPRSWPSANDMASPSTTDIIGQARICGAFCPRITLNATAVLCIRKTGIYK